MSNKIIEEQRRAREEFIRLKQMQNGEIAADTEVAEKIPLTFKEKLQNYWYHFKWHTIAGVCAAVILSVLITQCATKEKYDFMTVFFTYTPIMDTQIDEMEAYFEQYAKDIDGDGKVNVQVVNCSFSEQNSSTQVVQAALMKVQSLVAAEPKAILYIVDDKSEKYLNQIGDDGLLEVEAIPLGEDFYKSCEGEQALEKLPENLKIAYRKIGDTTMEKDKTAKAVYDVAKEIYSIIANKKTEAN